MLGTAAVHAVHLELQWPNKGTTALATTSGIYLNAQNQSKNELCAYELLVLQNSHVYSIGIVLRSTCSFHVTAANLGQDFQ